MAALHSLGRSALRVTKNYSKGYSHTQIKIRNATCNDPWPPSGKEMYELAQMTYDQNHFVEIMEVIDKRLNDKGKNWRHVFKSLLVLDYLIHSGSENVILYCQENIYEIKTLREFQYIDEDGRDEGANVRAKAAAITNLLSDKKQLFHERRVRAQMRDRMSGRNSADTDIDDEDDDVPLSNYRRTRPLPNGLDRVVYREDEDLQRAIEESKRSAAQAHATAEDEDLARALKLSAEDEEKRKQLVDANAHALFDDRNQLPPPTAQNESLVDASMPLQYATTGIQPQFTSIPPQFTSFQPQYAPVQPQFTSYNPYFQQAQQEAMQVEYLRQQAEFAQQQAEAQQAAFYQQQQQQQQQPKPLVPQTTAFGTNNPFAPPPSASSAPPLSSPSALGSGPRPASRGVSFNLTGTYDARPRSEPPRSKTSATSRPIERPRTGPLLRPFATGTEPPRRVGEDARLASLFANYTGDGVDTFGNVGQMRFGQTQFGRIASQKTGGPSSSQSQSHNPFLNPPSLPSPVEEQPENEGSNNLIRF